MLIRDVWVDGACHADVRLAHGRIAAIGQGLGRDADEIDGAGGALIAGLVDHHCHLLASAARTGSLDVAAARGEDDLAARLRGATGTGWLRVTGCAPALAATLDAGLLDRWCPARPVRVQDQTGALWVLNGAALARVGPLPAAAERDAAGRPTGRIWRGDAWLADAIGRVLPDLAPVGRALARLGITAITDASATTDAASAGVLATAHRVGDLPQRLTLMSAGPLAAPEDGSFAVGPVKVLLDERTLLPFDEFLARIERARAVGRNVAVHCVTAAELALTLAAFTTTGSRAGDRIEHGGVIAPDAVPGLRALGVAVVTQPGFVAERGDRYLAEADPADRPDLYRCASLLAAGVPVAGSSDSPYAGWDCWQAMRTAATRETAAGRPLGPAERLDPLAALNLYRGDPARPGGPPRRLAVGAPADLCLLDGPLPRHVDELDAARVRATFIAGRPVHRS